MIQYVNIFHKMFSCKYIDKYFTNMLLYKTRTTRLSNIFRFLGKSGILFKLTFLTNEYYVYYFGAQIYVNVMIIIRYLVRWTKGDKNKNKNCVWFLVVIFFHLCQSIGQYDSYQFLNIPKTNVSWSHIEA